MNRYSLIQRHQFPNFRVLEFASHRIRTTGSARVPSSLMNDFEFLEFNEVFFPIDDHHVISTLTLEQSSTNHNSSNTKEDDSA